VQLWGAIIPGILWLIGNIYVFSYAIKNKVRWPIFLTIGDLLTTMYEPVNNVFGHVVYGNTPDIPYLELDTRHLLPVTVFCYGAAYTTPMCVWIIDRLQKGTMTPSTWWKFLGCQLVFSALFEQIPIHFKLWQYFGPTQAFGIGFPSWWWFINTAANTVPEVVVYLMLKSWMPDRKSYYLIILFPMIYMGAAGGTALPAWTALNSANDATVSNIGGLIAIGFALALFYAISRLIEWDRASRKPTESSIPVSGAAQTAPLAPAARSSAG
jgi:hypothetical protein